MTMGRVYGICSYTWTMASAVKEIYWVEHGLWPSQMYTSSGMKYVKSGF